MSTGFTGRSYGDLRNADAVLDQDPNNSNNILLIYNRASVPSTWDSGVTSARELMAVSLLGTGDPSNSYVGMESDEFLHSYPINPSINSSRRQFALRHGGIPANSDSRRAAIGIPVGRYGRHRTYDVLRGDPVSQL